MDDVLAVLLGAGALALSPLLSPKLRPVAKSAVKGGMLVTAMATTVASVTGETVQDAVSRVREEINAAKESDKVSTDTATGGETSETVETKSAGAGVNTATAAATTPLAQSLRPVVNSAVKGGQVVAGIAVGVANRASEQWNGLVAEAQAERAIKIAPCDAASDMTGGPIAAPAERTGVTTADSTIRGMPVANTKETTDIAAGIERVPDNLRLIKGIGPKTAKHLKESGILTYEQLAVMDQTRLHEILGKGSAYYRSVDPSSWSRQARHLSEAREK